MRAPGAHLADAPRAQFVQQVAAGRLEHVCLVQFVRGLDQAPTDLLAPPGLDLELAAARVAIMGPEEAHGV